MILSPGLRRPSSGRGVSPTPVPANAIRDRSDDVVTDRADSIIETRA